MILIEEPDSLSGSYIKLPTLSTNYLVDVSSPKNITGGKARAAAGCAAHIGNPAGVYLAYAKNAHTGRI